MYLDTNYVHINQLPPLVKKGIIVFKDHLLDLVHDHLFEDIMSQIRNARNSIDFDAENTREILIFMAQLGLENP